MDRYTKSRFDSILKDKLTRRPVTEEEFDDIVEADKQALKQLDKYPKDYWRSDRREKDEIDEYFDTISQKSFRDRVKYTEIYTMINRDVLTYEAKLVYRLTDGSYFTMNVNFTDDDETYHESMKGQIEDVLDLMGMQMNEFLIGFGASQWYEKNVKGETTDELFDIIERHERWTVYETVDDLLERRTFKTYTYDGESVSKFFIFLPINLRNQTISLRDIAAEQEDAPMEQVTKYKADAGFGVERSKDNCLMDILFQRFGYDEEINKFTKKEMIKYREALNTVGNCIGPEILEVPYKVNKNGSESTILSKFQIKARIYLKVQKDLEAAQIIEKQKPILSFGTGEGNITKLELVLSDRHIYVHEAKNDDLETNVIIKKKIPRTGSFARIKTETMKGGHRYITYASKYVTKNGILKNNIYKQYDPCNLLGIATNDPNYKKTSIKLKDVTDPFRQGFTLLKNKKRLTSVKDVNLRHLIDTTSSYIGTTKLAEITNGALYATDMKGSYGSFESSPLYEGIPTGIPFITKTKIEGRTPTFYVLEAGYHELPKIWGILNKDHNTLLTYPQYHFLQQDYHLTLPCQAYIYFNLKDIKYAEFINGLTDNIKKLGLDQLMPERKELANRIIGHMIAGAKNNRYEMKWDYDTDTERSEIIKVLMEAEKKEFLINCFDEEHNIVKKKKYPQMSLDTNKKEAYLSVPCPYVENLRHVHSVILSIAQIGVLRMINKINRQKGLKVVVVKTDAITFEHDNTQESLEFIKETQRRSEDVEPGSFKFEQVKQNVLDLAQYKEPKETMAFEIPEHFFWSDATVNHLNKLKDKGLLKFDSMESSNKLAFIGPGGIGKTYCAAFIRDHVVKNCKIVLTAPTNNLANTSDKGFKGTAHKEYNLMSTKKMFKSNDSVQVVNDEIFMFSQKQLDTMLKNDKPMIVMGDECQLKCIKGDHITIEYLEKKGFTIVTFIRPKCSHKKFRHRDQTGAFLDSMRQYVKSKNGSFMAKFEKTFDKNLTDTDFIRQRNYDFNGSIEDIDETCRVIVNTNKEAIPINKKMKQMYIDKKISLFPCKLIRKEIKKGKIVRPKGFRLLIDVNDPAIWWDRQNMNDKPDKSLKLLYEPCFCTTVYSSQGTEFEKCTSVYIARTKDDFAAYTAITRCRTFKQIKFVDL